MTQHHLASPSVRSRAVYAVQHCVQLQQALLRAPGVSPGLCAACDKLQTVNMPEQAVDRSTEKSWQYNLLSDEPKHLLYRLEGHGSRARCLCGLHREGTAQSRRICVSKPAQQRGPSEHRTQSFKDTMEIHSVHKHASELSRISCTVLGTACRRSV